MRRLYLATMLATALSAPAQAADLTVWGLQAFNLTSEAVGRLVPARLFLLIKALGVTYAVTDRQLDSSDAIG